MKLFIALFLLFGLFGCSSTSYLKKSEPTTYVCKSGNCTDGFGTYFYKKDSYTGFFLSGKRHGEGSYFFSDGSEYFGTWNNDRIYGNCKYRSNSYAPWSIGSCEHPDSGIRFIEIDLGHQKEQSRKKNLREEIRKKNRGIQVM